MTIGNPYTQLDTPALWTDLSALDRNIAALAAYFCAAGVQWRPHTKGIKTPAVAHKLLAAGAHGVTCAKLGEAEVMAAAGVRSILVANQIVTPSKILRLAALAAQCDLIVAVDDASNVDAIAAAARARGVRAGLVIEVDTGMQRAGVAPGAPTLALARHIADTDGVALRGLMTWEGHNLAIEDPDEKRAGVAASIRQLTDTADACRAAGMPIEIVSCGGSGTYVYTAHLPGVTEIQAGGGIFCDVTYQSWGVPLEPALFVRASVTSRPAADRVILDAGFKTLPRGYASARPIGVEHVAAVVHSAEHCILTLTQPNTQLHIGDGVDFVVGYGDATVFLHDVLYGVRDGVVEAAWPVLGRGKLQ
jgi:D-serine deaminase-like pyridoxal phosphate-dependent protein